MKFRQLSLLLAVFLVAQSAFALSPTAEFEKKEDFGEVKNFRHSKQDVDLSVMDSDLKYADLSQKNVNELKDLFETKKEYGKFFGFKDWTPKEHKLVEEKSQRILLLSGNYKNSDNKTVHFLEVYWADKTKSGQYLLTSDTKEFKLDHYKDYLKL